MKFLKLEILQESIETLDEADSGDLDWAREISGEKEAREKAVSRKKQDAGVISSNTNNKGPDTHVSGLVVGASITTPNATFVVRKIDVNAKKAKILNMDTKKETVIDLTKMSFKQEGTTPLGKPKFKITGKK
jgi:hypothetical protein